MLIRFLVYPLLIYLAVMLVVMLLENYLLFQPTRAGSAWYPPPPELNAQDVDWLLADGTRIHGWWCPAPGSKGAVVFCHGNGGNLSFCGQFALAWQQGLGESVLLFDYPGYGKSDGKPSEQGCYAAAESAVDWLVAERKASPERIYLFGDSLGSGVAVELAQRRPYRALILHSPFTSIPDMGQKHYPWLPARWLARNQFNILAKIDRCPQPVFIAHGDRDCIVPFAHGERVFARANEPKRFLRLDDCDHEDIPLELFFGQLREFLLETRTAAKNMAVVD